MGQQLGDDDLKFLGAHSVEIEWVKHHDALLHTRTGFWMAGQSIAGAVVASAQTLEPLRLILVSVFGLGLTALWFLTCRSLATKITAYNRRLLPEAFRNAWHGAPEPKGFRRAFLAGSFLVYWLPAVFAIAWVAMLVNGGLRAIAAA